MIHSTAERSANLIEVDSDNNQQSLDPEGFDASSLSFAASSLLRDVLVGSLLVNAQSMEGPLLVVI